jgi:hypothetical protein
MDKALSHLLLSNALGLVDRLDFLVALGGFPALEDMLHGLFRGSQLLMLKKNTTIVLGNYL